MAGGGPRKTDSVPARVPLVGLTGAIGTGKSEALRALERHGGATISSDALVHELLAADDVRELVVGRLGAEVAPNGVLDRQALARVVFERPDDREWLERVLWPRVAERVARWREELERGDRRPPAAVVEAPLLFEAGMEDLFDSTVAVVAEESVRRARARRRGHAGVEARTSRQLSQAEKAERADLVVHNDGSLAELDQRMAELLATISS